MPFSQNIWNPKSAHFKRKIWRGGVFFLRAEWGKGPADHMTMLCSCQYKKTRLSLLGTQRDHVHLRAPTAVERAGRAERQVHPVAGSTRGACDGEGTGRGTQPLRGTHRSWAPAPSPGSSFASSSFCAAWERCDICLSLKFLCCSISGEIKYHKRSSWKGLRIIELPFMIQPDARKWSNTCGFPSWLHASTHPRPFRMRDGQGGLEGKMLLPESLS